MNLHSFFRFKTSSLSNFKPFLIWSTPRRLNGFCSSKNLFPLVKIVNNMRRSARKRPTVEAKTCKVTGSSDSIIPDVATGKKRTKKNKKAPDNDQANDETSPYFQNTNDPSAAPPEPEPGERLGRSFYDQDAVTLAKALLGKVLCRKLPETGQVLKGTVVETEAYPGKGDAASRSFKGVPTPSSMAMFMDPGTAYVYFTYGMYYCFNVSAKEYGGACLLRAIQVHEDYEIMHTLRLRQSKKEQASDKPPKRLKQHELANGPAKLCLAFGITRDTCDKVDMASSDELWLEESLDPTYHQRQFEIEVSRRVGIDSTPPEARDQPYRFYIADNKSVSPAKFKEITNKKTKRGGSK